MALKTLSIRTRLILLITVVATVILAGISLAISRSLYREMERKVVGDFDKTQFYLRQMGSLIYDRLVESCLLIGQNAAFKANVALEHPPSVQQAIEEFAQFTKTDLLLVTNARGRVLGWLGRPGAVGQDISDWPGVAPALAGEEPALALENAVLWEVDDELLQVVTVPVSAGGNLLGAISMGTRFTDAEASFLKGRSDIEISMFLEGRVVGSSITDSVMPDRAVQLALFHQNYRSRITDAIASGETGEVFPARFAGKQVFAFVTPLGLGARGYFVALAERDKELALLKNLSREILLIGLAGFVLAGLLAMFLGNRFSRPILDLAYTMDQVKEGNLDARLPVRSNDEIGRLTGAFNNMLQGLKERFYLTKYVGGHTLDMIRSEEGGWESAKGKRMDVAVLFTDIRGFTAFSEENEPEVVIEMLNSWLGFQAELVRESGGVVDKYAGDEMFALFFGADSLQQAYRCAQDIQLRATLQPQQQGVGVRIGIGLNFGPVVMGNIGAESRLDYTVIGASVNLGARLCGAAQGGEILLTAETAHRLGLDTTGLDQEDMQFKGISQPVRVVRIREQHLTVNT